MWTHDQRVIWLKVLKFIVVSHQFAKFSSHRPGGNRDASAKTIY